MVSLPNNTDCGFLSAIDCYFLDLLRDKLKSINSCSETDFYCLFELKRRRFSQIDFFFVVEVQRIKNTRSGKFSLIDNVD